VSAVLLGCMLMAPAAISPAPLAPPKTPEGMPQCKAPLAWGTDLPRSPGETIRYVIDVNGLSVGTVDFRIERRGLYEGKPVTEYRSVFKIDQLVGVLMPMDGRAASIVPDTALVPMAAMSKYRVDKTELEENQTFGEDGRSVIAKRKRNGKESVAQREFPMQVRDFVSSFYLLRTLPAGAQGCAIIYGNQRAYTVWLKLEGDDKVKTPVGLRPATRYSVLYASEKGKKPIAARVWLGQDKARLPYRAEIEDKTRLEARIHLYETGS